MNFNTGLVQQSQDNFYLNFFEDFKDYPIRIGLMFNILFNKKKICYKTFQRIVDEYVDRGFLNVEKQLTSNGNTTIIKSFNKLKMSV